MHKNIKNCKQYAKNCQKMQKIAKSPNGKNWQKIAILLLKKSQKSRPRFSGWTGRHLTGLACVIYEDPVLQITSMTEVQIFINV